MKRFCIVLDTATNMDQSESAGKLALTFDQNQSILREKGILLPPQTVVGRKRNGWNYIADRYERRQSIQRKADVEKHLKRLRNVRMRGSKIGRKKIELVGERSLKQQETMPVVIVAGSASSGIKSNKSAW